MLRRSLDKLLSVVKSHRRLSKLTPLISGIDNFLYEPDIVTKTGPHIRDSVDVKRWMTLVVMSLLPCTFIAIWNSGLQEYIYSSSDLTLMKDYLVASSSFSSYFDFVLTDQRYLTILKEGLLSFIPVLLISYLVGGFWEVLFACIRGHDIAEGFLVTGILFPLILPPSIPYWMVAVGVSFGIVVGKELFGGTGMNILNPALVCRTFLYFSFPQNMTGQIWAGRNSSQIKESIKAMNEQGNLLSYDAISQESALSVLNLSRDVKRVHIDAIASHNLGKEVPSLDLIQNKLSSFGQTAALNDLSTEKFQGFLKASDGLGLSADNVEAAYRFTDLKYGVDLFSNGNLFFGNKLGSFGEVSILACLLGALFLLMTKLGSWRIMLSFFLGVLITAFTFEYGSKTMFSPAWNPAIFDFPFYKHFFIGSIVFGLVFMATDPVSAPAMNSSKWVYGFLIGFLVIFIRLVNPAYPEGVMLAILFANVFAPLIDHYASRIYRRGYVRKA